MKTATDAPVTKQQLDEGLADVRKEMHDMGTDIRKEMREGFDDVLQVLDTMMTRIDARFVRIEEEQAKMRKEIAHILTRLDHIDKQLEISEDERLVMAHQITKLYEWAVQAGERIGLKFVP